MRRRVTLFLFASILESPIAIYRYGINPSALIGSSQTEVISGFPPTPEEACRFIVRVWKFAGFFVSVLPLIAIYSTTCPRRELIQRVRLIS